MKGLGLRSLTLGFCIISTPVYASTPVWSFSPIGSPVVTVNSTGTGTLSYTLTNNSKKPHQLVLSSLTPTGISQLGGPCVLAGKSPTNPNPTCTLTLIIKGSALPANYVSGGPIMCQSNSNGSPNPNQCYQPNPGDSLVIRRTTPPGATTLNTSISILALSVNNPALNSALTGNERLITITNTGINEAVGLNISYPIWPGGIPATTASSTCGSSLAAGAACTITIKPGVNPTSNCNTGIAPTPGTIRISAANATSVTSNVLILSYGCQYQGGFLYSVDDTTNNGISGTCSLPPCMGSIGGKVASLVDQAAPLIVTGPQESSLIWSSNGSGSADSNISEDIIPLISEIATVKDSYASARVNFNANYSNEDTFPFPPSSAFVTCNAASEGLCNSTNILTLYDTYITGYGIAPSPYTLSAGPTNRTYYAAGLCRATINSYSDWYLPALCEMDAIAGEIICPAGAQSIVENLVFLIGDLSAATPSTSCNPPSGTDCLAGVYWSSTQYSGTPQRFAWAETYATIGGNHQVFVEKFSQLGVRCSRILTP